MKQIVLAVRTATVSVNMWQCRQRTASDVRRQVSRVAHDKGPQRRDVCVVAHVRVFRVQLPHRRHVVSVRQAGLQDHLRAVSAHQRRSEYDVREVPGVCAAGVPQHWRMAADWYVYTNKMNPST